LCWRGLFPTLLVYHTSSDFATSPSAARRVVVRRQNETLPLVTETFQRRSGGFLLRLVGC
jgi:chorismate-pyruvate lyase